MSEASHDTGEDEGSKDIIINETNNGKRVENEEKEESEAALDFGTNVVKEKDEEDRNNLQETSEKSKPDVEDELLEKGPDKDERNQKGEDVKREMEVEDFSTMTIDQLDSYLHDNNEESYNEEDGEEEEEEVDEDGEADSEDPISREECSAGSDQIRMPSEYLNADNPLMVKFQAIIKTHLLREIAKLREDSAELTDRYERDLLAYHEAGEGIERLTAQKNAGDKRIEELREKLETSKGERERVGREHSKWKKKSEEDKEQIDELENNYQELQMKTENLSHTAQQLETLEMQRQSELSIARIQSAKSAQEIENLLSNDLKQDVLSLMINHEINKLERSLTEAQDQYEAKAQEMRIMLVKLGDARTDLESMERENKKINEAWGQLVSSIQGKQKEYLETQEEARLIREKLRELEISTVNTRKAWTGEKYNGERITVELNKYAKQVDNLNRTIGRKEILKSNLQRQLMTLSKIVERNEAHIGEFTRLEARMNKEREALTSACDGLASNVRQFENEILEKYQTNYVVNNKELTALSEDIRRLKRQNQELEVELASCEHKMSTVRLEIDQIEGLKKQTSAGLDAVKQEIAVKLKEIEYIEKRIQAVKDRVNVIQAKTFQESRALEFLQQGENAKSLKDKMIDTVRADTEELCSSLKELKSQWIRKQSQLMDLMEEHNENLKSINDLEWQNHQFGYKLNKQNKEIEDKSMDHEKLLSSVERLKKRIDRDIQKTAHSKEMETLLNVENALRQDMYYNQLKDAEKELYGLKQEILSLEREERTYLRDIENAESVYLSWEKKCALASKEKEKYEMEKKPGGEIEQLKREIHRMEMRHAQLKSVQKKLMADLEACVTRRERIMDNVRAREKRHSKEDTKRYIHVKKVQQLRHQVKQVLVEIKTMEKLSEEYKAKKEDLINENTNKQNQLKSLQENIEKVERQLQEGYLHKQKNLEILIRKQRRSRQYCQLKDGKYRPLFRTEASLELESMKQADTNQTLVSLLGTLLGDFPSLQYSFRKILNTLKLSN